MESNHDYAVMATKDRQILAIPMKWVINKQCLMIGQRCEWYVPTKKKINNAIKYDKAANYWNIEVGCFLNVSDSYMGANFLAIAETLKIKKFVIVEIIDSRNLVVIVPCCSIVVNYDLKLFTCRLAKMTDMFKGQQRHNWGEYNCIPRKYYDTFYEAKQELHLFDCTTEVPDENNKRKHSEEYHLKSSDNCTTTYKDLNMTKKTSISKDSDLNSNSIYDTTQYQRIDKSRSLANIEVPDENKKGKLSAEYHLKSSDNCNNSYEDLNMTKNKSIRTTGTVKNYNILPIQYNVSNRDNNVTLLQNSEYPEKQSLKGYNLPKVIDNKIFDPKEFEGILKSILLSVQSTTNKILGLREITQEIKDTVIYNRNKINSLYIKLFPNSILHNLSSTTFTTPDTTTITTTYTTPLTTTVTTTITTTYTTPLTTTVTTPLTSNVTTSFITPVTTSVITPINPMTLNIPNVTITRVKPIIPIPSENIHIYTPKLQFPIKKIEDLLTLDADEYHKRYLIQMLLNNKKHDVKQTTYQMMRLVMNNKVACLVKMTNRKSNKLCLMDMDLYKIIVGCIRYFFPNEPLLNIKKCIRDWIRRAPSRKQYD